MIKFKSMLMAIGIIGAICHVVWACTFNSNCNGLCDVLTYLHVDGDGYEYAGGRATYLPKVFPGQGGTVGPDRLVIYEFYLTMCKRCKLTDIACEGESPANWSHGGVINVPQECLGAG
jgi:hypothetical protein